MRSRQQSGLVGVLYAVVGRAAVRREISSSGEGVLELHFRARRRMALTEAYLNLEEQ